MLVFPAIDLLDGKAVRLSQGRKETAKVYSEDPPALARDFAAAGATRLHVVDLDASFTGGTTHNRDTVKAIVAASTMEVEVGGGEGAGRGRRFLGVDLRRLLAPLREANGLAVQ